MSMINNKYKMIVAADENWCIGNKGKLLDHFPEDMKFFKFITMNKCVVMGDNTQRSLPNLYLKNRFNIVLSYNDNNDLQNIIKLEDNDTTEICYVPSIQSIPSCIEAFNYFNKETKKFYEVYETIIDNYYGDINKDDLMDGAISGMMESVGDTYTTYSNSTSTDEFNEVVNGVYEGIGATIQQSDKGIIVIGMYENSPSAKAGLKIGDKILKVDEIDATKTDATALSTYIKGKKEKEVNMTVDRNGKEMKIKLIREKIETPVVDSEIYEKNGKKVGCLKISIFSSVASKQFAEKLAKLESKKIDSLVIDVRDNNGGYLSTVVDIASQLLPKGEIIYQIEKNNDKTEFKDKTKESRDYPIAILVNNSSASASEILAAAIKESYNGLVVGTKTYGKGTVQQIKSLSDGSMIKYTMENWLSPKGEWIDGKGITPTNIIEQSENYFNEAIPTNDIQLQKALELVSK